ncbi:rRNA maturation RNase YbeY [Patescibacteria group bacterium]|nr:rRNA maturation RNase YbeY [Patescibacteria group bacterium]
MIAPVSFVYTEKLDKKVLSTLQKLSAFAVGKLKLSKLDISIIFVTEAKIKQLNKLYRKKDKITDVLSFFYGNEGEVFICLKQAIRQAKENNLDLEEELIKLTIHGLTHIAGYDHEKDSDYIKMSKVEKNIYDLFQKNI